MPIYQYDCGKCEQRVEVLHRSASSAAKPKCPECGSTRLTRVMSTFARRKTASDRLEGVDVEAQQAALQGGDEKSFARWARRAGAEYDEALGTNYRELAEQAEAGEDPVDRIDAGHSFQHRVEDRKAKVARAKQAKDEA
jgi:putative FmdB family regulatory protein